MNSPAIIFSGDQPRVQPGETGPKPWPRLIHRMKFVAPQGDQQGYVSALCYKSPRPIDVAKSGWTVTESKVTCRKCEELIKLGYPL